MVRISGLEELSAIVWDRNNATDIGEWSMWGGGRLERFYCICIYISNFDMTPGTWLANCE